MSSTQLDRNATPAVAVPGRVGQGTAIEQSRAVAEVQAAVVVAQQVPRRIPVAVNEMRASCEQRGLADRAFYRYSRGGGSIQGASVHLARELARCWGNVQYGIAELRRDDDAGQSEMQAWAWDVQTNTRSANIFVVPHKRDKRGGPEVLTDMRDIYENNANNGARRLREAIFSILPPWFVEEAKELCTRTLERGDGTPLADRATGMVAAFTSIGIREDQLVQRLGRPREHWSGNDLGQMGVVFRSIQRGEVLKEDEFPTERVTAAEVVAKPKPAAAKAKAKPADVDPLAWRDEALNPDTSRERLGQMLAAVIGTGQESPVVVNENGDDEPLVVLIDRILADRLGGGPML